MKRCSNSFVFAALFCFGLGGKLPSTFKTCKRYDPDLDNCFARAIEHALPYLKEPIPELRLPSLYPAIIERVTIGPGSEGIVNVTQTLSDVAIYNLIDSKITKTKLTMGSEDYKAVVHVYNRQVKAEADYDIDGTVLSVPIAGKGKGYMDLDDELVIFTLNGKLYKKKNKTYVKLTDLKVEVSPAKVTFKLDNLFNGNEKLGKDMNGLLNENWKIVFNDVKGLYELTLSVYFKSIFDAVYDRVPFDELYPL